MAKHQPLCWVVNVLLFVGGLNWGLVGLGGFLGSDLNLVKALLGSWPQVEWLVYLLVGLSALAFGYMALSCKECACTKMEKK